MICSRCKTQNPDGNTFCLECGASLDPFVTADKESYQPQSAPESTNNPFEPNVSPYTQPQPYEQQSYQQPYQQPYQQNMVNYPAGYNYQDDDHVTTLQWLGIWALNIIPFVGTLIYIVLMFIWAFGDTRKKSLKTYAKSQLIIFLICIVLGLIIIFSVNTFSFDRSALSSLDNS